MKKRFLFLVAVTLTALVITSGCKSRSSQTKKDPRPNIIYIMSDDHGYQAVSAYGSPSKNRLIFSNKNRFWQISRNDSEKYVEM